MAWGTTPIYYKQPRCGEHTEICKWSLQEKIRSGKESLMSERGSTTTLNNTSRTRRRAYSLSLFFFWIHRAVFDVISGCRSSVGLSGVQGRKSLERQEYKGRCWSDSEPTWSQPGTLGKANPSFRFKTQGLHSHVFCAVIKAHSLVTGALC